MLQVLLPKHIVMGISMDETHFWNLANHILLFHGKGGGVHYTVSS